MKLEFIKPRTELQPYIDKLWLFESEIGLSATSEKSLIVPNAKPKIMIPYKNSLATTDRGKTTICRENDICFIGIRDVPVNIGTLPGANGSIGIELTTAGAYKFLNVPFHQLKNTLFSFTDLYGRKGRELLEIMMNHENPQFKIEYIQRFLLEKLKEEKRNNLLVDYSVNLISSSHGLIEIKELQQRTGYSKRYLDLLFKDHLGISPKTFSTISRFQHFYKSWVKMNAPSINKNTIYELYYDQSHFIKEFKRYTGLTPMQYAGFNNDFGKNF